MKRMAISSSLTMGKASRETGQLGMMIASFVYLVQIFAVARSYRKDQVKSAGRCRGEEAIPVLVQTIKENNDAKN